MPGATHGCPVHRLVRRAVGSDVMLRYRKLSLPGLTQACQVRAQAQGRDGLRSAGAGSSGRIWAAGRVNHLFTLGGQVPTMPQATVGIRPPAGGRAARGFPGSHRPGRMLPGTGCRKVNRTGLGQDPMGRRTPGRVRFGVPNDPSLGDRPVRVHMRDDLPDVPIDIVQMDQVLTNLIENAVHYSPPGTEIGVTAVRWHDTVEVRVIDHGPGIPVQDRAKVFEEFYQRDVDGHRGGTGLGLSIAQAVVLAHGGTMWVEETPGGGATVGFRVAAEPARRTPPTGSGRA